MYLCTRIWFDHISTQPNRGQIHIEGQRSMSRMQRLLEGVKIECQSCLCSRIRMLEVFYGLCAYYYNF